MFQISRNRTQLNVNKNHITEKSHASELKDGKYNTTQTSKSISQSI